MTKPVVIIVNDFAFVNGGASRVAITEAATLARRGHEVVFFAAVGPIGEELRGTTVCVVLLDKPDLARHPRPMIGMVTGLWNRGAANRLAQVLNSCRRPAVIHLHTWVKALSPAIWSVIRRSGIPAVVTAHDYFLACPNGGFYNYQTHAICPLRAMSLLCALAQCDKRNYAHKAWRLARQTVQRTIALPASLRHLIAVSDFSANVLRSYLSSRTLVHRIDNPVIARMQPAAVIDEHSSYLFAGRLEPEKGADLFVEAAARRGVVPTFVGDGVLSQQILTRAPHARLTGWLDPDRLEQELLRARVLVFPSRLYETMGLVILEAAARGVAAIVPDTCAAAEFVEQGRTGIIYPATEPDGLDKALGVFTDLSAARRMGGAAWEKYWARPLTMERHAEQLETLYASMLGESES